MHAASLSTLATYLKASAPKAIASALEQGTFQSLLDLKRTLHLSNATIGYLQAFVMSSRNPTKVQRHSWRRLMPMPVLLLVLERFPNEDAGPPCARS